MRKIVCDMCGKDMTLEKPVKIKFCISSNGRAWDICSECRNELDKLMRRQRIESEK
jgi:hypothetical protein